MSSTSVSNLTVTRGKGLYPVVINRDLCTGCGKCIERCTNSALSLDDENRIVLDERLCLGYGGCIYVCPVAAIRFE